MHKSISLITQNDNLLKALVYGLIAGLSVAGLLIIYQPFGTYEYSSSTKYWFLAGYGIIAFVCVFFSYLITAKFYQLDSLLKISTVFLFSLLISTAISFLYKQWYFELPISWSHFIGYLPFGLMMMPLPLGIIIGLEYRGRAQTLNSNPSLQLRDSNGREFIQFKANDLLLIKAADNYVEIIQNSNGVVKTELLRLRLSSALEQLTEHPNLLQCHRSYLVNMSQVSNGSGSKQSFSLAFKASDIEVPVSRKYLQKVQELLGVIAK